METLEGKIEERPLPEVLMLLARKAGSGIMTVQGEQEIIGLSVLQGELVSADALNQSLEEGLGRILTGSGLVSNDVLANLSAEHHSGGGRVVDLLLERSYIGSETLHAALREHAYRLCIQVLAWKEGEYKFYRGDEVAFEEGVEPIPIEELLVRAAEELQTERLLGGRPPPTEAVYERVDRLDDALAPETLGELLAPGLTVSDPGVEIQSLLDRVDGSRTVSSLARDTGMSEFRARLMLLRMEQADLLRRRREAMPGGRQAFAAKQQSEAVEASLAALPLRRLEPEVPPAPVTVPLPVLAPVEESPPPVAVPEPVPEPVPRPKPAASRAAPPPWLAQVLAAGLLVAVAAYSVAAPWRVVLPFPWHADLRQAFDAERQSGILLQVGRAARTFFLLEGRFPESLAELAEVVPNARVVDARGRPLVYASTATSFSLQAPGGATWTEGIGGDFLLDPEFQVRSSLDEPPLVLLD